MTSEKKELMNVASDEQLALINSEIPQESSYVRKYLPRINMLSQDKTEVTGTGKNKQIKVIAAAGAWYIDREDGVDEDGKKKFVREYLEEEEIEMIFSYFRRQLSLWDEATESYISSPIYDTPNEIVPLFQSGEEIARGTEKELRAMYPALTKKGKSTSKLDEVRVCYVLYKGEAFEMNIKRSSNWAFGDYKKNTAVGSVLTRIGSEERQNGDVTYSVMKFSSVRKITAEEATQSLALISEIKQAVAAEKEYYGQNTEVVAEKKALDEKFDKEF